MRSDKPCLRCCCVTRPLLAHTIIFLFFLGFETKAGILPWVIGFPMPIRLPLPV